MSTPMDIKRRARPRGTVSTARPLRLTTALRRPRACAVSAPPIHFRSHRTVPAILDKLLRIGEGKILRQLEGISQAVNAIEDDFVAMSDEELQGMTAELRERHAKGESLDD